MKKEYIIPFLKQYGIWLIIILITSLSIGYNLYFFKDKLEPLFVLIFSILTLVFMCWAFWFKNKDSENLTDVQFLNQKKQEYLNQILGALKLNISDKLRKNLESGDLDNAQEEISDKIKALNNLIETVKGDNTNALRGTDISSVSEFYESTNARIRTEIKRINNGSYWSMGFGLGATCLVIFILFMSLPVLHQGDKKSVVSFFDFFAVHRFELIEILPRITLSILVQAFAFFFFNQYRKQQEEIKYWNNEKTNLDLKIFALSIAIDNEEIGTHDFMRNIITELIKPNKNLFGSNQDKEKIEEKPKEELEPTKIVSDLLGKIKDLTEQLNKK